MSGAPENLAVHAVNPDEDEAEPGNLETSRVWVFPQVAAIHRDPLQRWEWKWFWDV